MKKKCDDDKSNDDLRDEYDFSKMKKVGIRGKYFYKYHGLDQPVFLDPDIAKAFPTPSAVNSALRALMSLMQSVQSNLTQKSTLFST